MLFFVLKSLMSAHLAGTSAGLLFGAGIFAFVKTRSVPSLVGASTLGLLFTTSAVLSKISDQQILAHGLGLLGGAASLAIGVRRYPTAARKFAPVLLMLVGAVNVPYQTYKVYEWLQ
jgi:uncharacterized membrane protein (UPF0136 family)